MRIYYRHFRTRGIYANIPVFRQTIKTGMEKDIFPPVARALEARAANWVNQVRMQMQTRLDTKGISLVAWPYGAGAKFWRMVSGGVKGRWIVVKKPTTFRRHKKYRPALRLQRYVPHTLSGTKFGYSGVKFGPTAYRRAVWWPGIYPRHFEEAVIKEFKSDWIRLMRNVVARATRAAVKAGR